MASPYPAYAPRDPQSNIPYSNITHPSTYPYPPHSNSRYDASAASLDSDSSESAAEPYKPPGSKEYGPGPRPGPGGYAPNQRVGVDFRAPNRTPSPTPSEAKELAKDGIFDWQAMMKWRYWIRREWLWYYVAFVICLVGVILFTVYHKQIVDWLRPAADWMHDLPFGWTIPIGVLFVISFPPLFGHEIVAILCGLVWGLGLGFGIVAAGTFLGELGNFYAFKWCCAARGEKLERTKLQYACLARVVRDGGFKIALIARLSAIPGHFTTAVFSTCGMGVWTFSLAAILSLPKQFITVYLGVALEQSEDGKSSTKDTIIKDTVLGVTTLVTIGAMWYIYHQMNKVKVDVIYQRRKARQGKLAMSTAPGRPYGNPAMMDSTTSVAFNPAAASETEIPLTATASKYGYGQAAYPVYAPNPRRPQQQNGYPMSERPPNGNGNVGLPPGAGYAYPVQPSQMPMQRVQSPPRNPFDDSARVPHPHAHPHPHASQPPASGLSYQRQAPPRGYGSPPPGTFAIAIGQSPRPQSPQIHTQQWKRASQAERVMSPPLPLSAPGPGPGPVRSAPQTPTQRTFEQYRGGVPPPTLPSVAGATSPPRDPFGDPVLNAYERKGAEERERERESYYGHAYGGMHEPEGSDSTFYTAHGGHSRGPTGLSDFGSGSEETVREGAPPPSYTSVAR